MVKFSDMPVKYQVFIEKEGVVLEAAYFETAQHANDFVARYNLRLPSGLFWLNSKARYMGACPIDT